MKPYEPRIKIKNLFGVVDCDFSFKGFMVFIGEQSVGKSTICKAIYYMRQYAIIAASHLKSLGTNGYQGLDASKRATLDKDFFTREILYKGIHAEFKNRFIEIFGVSWDKPNMLIQYWFSEEEYIKVSTSEGFLNTELYNITTEKLYDYAKEVWDIYVYETSVLFPKELIQKRVEVERRIEQASNNLFNAHETTYYIPAGRSLLTVLTNQVSSININLTDRIMGEFLKLISEIRPFFVNGLPTIDSIPSLTNTGNKAFTLSKPLEKQREQYRLLLKGEYYFNGEVETLHVKTNREDVVLTLNYISSGQQEILWVLNLLYWWSLLREKAFIIIEEPEAHLFPSAQQQIIDIISRFINYTESTVLLTTHSPYIITASNNHIFADAAIKSHPKIKDEIDLVVPPQERINCENFGAYYLGGEKYLNDIVNTDFMEIDATLIDVVSENINNTYDKIFDLCSEEDEV